MSVVAIFPVLNRPERVEDLVGSLYASWGNVPVHPLFVTTQGDMAEEAAIRAAGSDYLILPGERQPGDYARKINAAVRHVEETGGDWVLLGADDLCFCPSWADRAIETAGDTFDVVGTNDLGNPHVEAGNQSTHSLVRIRYRGTIDDPELMLHEGYIHNWVDREFVETAKQRGKFIFAPDAMVEHLHPNWGKAEMDDTYRLGLDLANFEIDRRLFHQREPLWRR